MTLLSASKDTSLIIRKNIFATHWGKYFLFSQFFSQLWLNIVDELYNVQDYCLHASAIFIIMWIIMLMLIIMHLTVAIMIAVGNKVLRTFLDMTKAI